MCQKLLKKLKQTSPIAVQQWLWSQALDSPLSAFPPDFQILFREHCWVDKSCLEMLETTQFGYTLRSLNWINRKISTLHKKHILLILPRARLGDAKSRWLQNNQGLFPIRIMSTKSQEWFSSSQSFRNPDWGCRVTITNPHAEEERIR